MPYVRIDTAGFTSMSRAAELAGLPLYAFWKLCRDEHLIPEPQSRVGRRQFYSEAEMLAVLTAVDELRTTGRIKPRAREEVTQ